MLRVRGLHSPDLGVAIALTCAAPVDHGASVVQNSFSQDYDPYRILKNRRK